jgi:predicted carbohydrate-binding protein with CBM5 and CBM33 domain
MEGRLPRGKTGRHLIYTIWQNSSTPDTYYSCSDVVFGAASGTADGAAAQQPTAGQPTAGSADEPTNDAAVQRVSTQSGGGGGMLPLAVGGVGLLVALVAGVAVVRRRRA